MARKTEKAQLNFQVAPRLAGKVRGDARRFGKSLDAVGETIVKDFYSAFPHLNDRRKFFEHTPNKRSGRKVGKI